jgi:hypothetical protein
MFYKISVMAITFIMSACGDGGGGNNNSNNNNNNNNDNNVDDGTIKLSGRLYYLTDDDYFIVIYDEYNGSDFGVGSYYYYDSDGTYTYMNYVGEGNVTSGQFSYILPSSTHSTPDAWFSNNFPFNNYSNCYTDVTAIPKFVLGYGKDIFSNRYSIGNIYREYITANAAGSKSGMRTEEYVAILVC